MKETREFQTESKELLNLMINSIYTNREIFLRELISNASDAIDKYKYLALTSKGKLPSKDYEIRLINDEKARTLNIIDNGIGMSKEELINNLGTIAKSGSKDFIKKFKEAQEQKDINIIGQFGVGFYSAFMVAEKIEVRTKSVDSEACLFTSSGQDSYTIEDCDKEDSGTEIKLYLKKTSKKKAEESEDFDRFLRSYELEHLVKKYSDYIRYPIKMKVKTSKPKLDKDGKEIEGKYEDVIEDKVLNSMIPLWRKNKKDVSDEELADFYRNKFADYEEPLFSVFLKVDGLINYDALLYVPSHAPYNLYSDNYEKGLQLYSKGIFIQEKCADLIPDYLKFVKGLVDSDTFNLNISRELLQKSPALKKIADNIEKKIVDRLKDCKKEDYDKYLKFWEIFGEHIKFGIYSSYGVKKELLKDLLVFRSLLNEDKYISLKDYQEKMPKDQKAIYFASGETIEGIKLLPQMEKYKKEGKDVLLLDKRIDEFCLLMMRDYGKLEFKSITAENQDDLSKADQERLDFLNKEHQDFLNTLKEGLGDLVDQVSFSLNLVEAPVCIATKEGLSLGMEKILNEQPGVFEKVKASKVLKINPDHELCQALLKFETDKETLKNYASLLYEEAMLLEGFEIKNRQDFVKKLNDLMLKSLNK